MHTESMQPFKIRGQACATTLKYCREGIPRERRQKVIEHLSAETIRAVESMAVNEWYAIERMSEMLDATIAASEGNHATAEQDLIGIGKFIGQEAANTFLRLIIKILTPSLFAKKLQSVYLRYNNKGKVSAEVSGDRMLVSFTDTKGFPHLPAIAAGWLFAVFEMMGKEVLSYKMKNWSITNGDNDSFEIEIVWKR